MPISQAEIDAITAAISDVLADDAAAANRLPAALATFAANHPALDLTALQAAVAQLDASHHFWLLNKLQQAAAS